MLTKEQMKNRMHGIGGSDAAAVIGKNRYKSALDVYLEKIGDKIHTNDENQFMHWGNVLEPVIIKEFEKRNNKKVNQTGNTFSKKDSHWMIAHVDGVVEGENAIIECKTASEYMLKEWQDGIPDEYYYQCMHYCAVLDVDRVYVCALVGGNKYIEHIFDRDLQKEAVLIAHEKKFWTENVEKRIPPDPQTIDDVIYLCSDEQETFTATLEIESLNYEHEILKEEIKKLTNQVNEIKKKIITTVQKPCVVYDESGNKLFSIKKQTRSSLDTKRIKEENPSLFSMYKKESSYLVIS